MVCFCGCRIFCVVYAGILDFRLRGFFDFIQKNVVCILKVQYVDNNIIISNRLSTDICICMSYYILLLYLVVILVFVVFCCVIHLRLFCFVLFHYTLSFLLHLGIFELELQLDPK